MSKMLYHLTFNDLPNEIVFIILFEVKKLKDIQSCYFVSKSWINFMDQITKIKGGYTFRLTKINKISDNIPEYYEVNEPILFKINRPFFKTKPVFFEFFKYNNVFFKKIIFFETEYLGRNKLNIGSEENLFLSIWCLLDRHNCSSMLDIVITWLKSIGITIDISNKFIIGFDYWIKNIGSLHRYNYFVSEWFDYHSIKVYKYFKFTDNNDLAIYLEKIIGIELPRYKKPKRLQNLASSIKYRIHKSKSYRAKYTISSSEIDKISKYTPYQYNHHTKHTSDQKVNSYKKNFR